MQITVKNRTSTPVSLPGILPRLLKSETKTVEISPEDFDTIKEPLATLRDAGKIEFSVELASSVSNEFTFDDDQGRILYKGTQIAPDPSGTDFHATGVQTIQNLRDIAVIDRVDRQVRLVEDAGAIYRFDVQGIGTDDGNLIIVPTIGTGRWFKTSLVLQGPASAQDLELTVFDGITGKLIKGAGVRHYGVSTTDPVTPAPEDGDRYYNTVLNLEMQYDGTRSKWLSVVVSIFDFGRTGNTPGGAFFRSIDGITYSATNGYHALYNGTVVALAYTRNNTTSMTFEIIENGITIASLLSAVISDRSVVLDGDFSAGGILGARSQTGGGTASAVVGWCMIRWRV